ncbi:MAG TPA: Pr6Pr family membrane protein [Dyella sp.]|nr:Pr6Pr family membrane protein [Dyella sp.]
MARGLALLGLLTGVSALALQFALTLALAHRQGFGTGRALWIYLGYFTILTNALGALSLARLAAGRRTGVLARGEDRTAIAACLLIVGLVYNVVLRQTWHPTGWARVADELLHVAMPLLYLATWWAARERGRPVLPRLLAWMAYPLGYLAYALARGTLDGRYPYPFLDVARLGWMRVLGNATLVGLAFLGVGAALAGWAARRSLPQAISGRAGPR